MTSKVTFLLGAGASVDAGLPVSAGLTRAIAEYLDDSLADTNTRVALNAAIGALVAHDSARGESAFAGVDVERLFSAVQMLANRRDLEVSPFVAGWNRSVIEDAPEWVAGNWSTEFQRALGLDPRSPGFDKWRVRRELERLISSKMPSTDSGSVYVNLQNAMMQALKSLLRVPKGADLSYLSAILTIEDSAQIATLNYDETVEAAASEVGISLSTGVDAWSGGFNWEWPEAADARLLKLHGSIDWSLIDGGRIGDIPADGVPVRPMIADLGPDEYVSYDGRGIIFGQREKLRAEGPFLAMLQEFNRWLSVAEDLVVVGYSFRDAHINIGIRDWFLQKPNGNLWIVDPEFPSAPPRISGRPSDFREMLADAAYTEVAERVETEHGLDLRMRIDTTKRFHVFRSGAATALPLIAQELAGRMQP